MVLLLRRIAATGRPGLWLVHKATEHVIHGGVQLETLDDLPGLMRRWKMVQEHPYESGYYFALWRKFSVVPQQSRIGASDPDFLPMPTFALCPTCFCSSDRQVKYSASFKASSFTSSSYPEHLPNSDEITDRLESLNDIRLSPPKRRRVGGNFVDPDEVRYREFGPALDGRGDGYLRELILIRRSTQLVRSGDALSEIARTNYHVTVRDELCGKLTQGVIDGVGSDFPPASSVILGKVRDLMVPPQGEDFDW